MVGSIAAMAFALALAQASEPSTGDAKPACTPATLDEAVRCLDVVLRPEDREKLLNSSIDGLTEYHMGLGMGMRNSWGLWSGGPLYKDLERKGFMHPDDMSTVILNSYWLDHHGCDRKLAEQAKYYRTWWKGMQAASRKAEANAKPGAVIEIKMPKMPIRPKLDCTAERSVAQ